MKLRLYHYWRSSSSWRVRWALAIKGIQCEFVPVNLLTDESEQPAHLERNPLGYVPVLEFLETKAPFKFLSESIAIIEWLEESQPEPSLLPGDPLQRARMRQLAQIINSGTQPLQNPNVACFYSNNPEDQKTWNRHWIHHGFKAYENLVAETAGTYSVGDVLTLPDLFLVPQCYNALRNGISLDDYPLIHKIYTTALSTSTGQASAPDQHKP